MTPQAILEALACGQPRCRCAVSARRGRGRTHCPVHQDNTPSFGVDQKNGKLLAYCYTGCEQDTVITALKERGLWPENAKYGQEIIAEYDYRDASGQMLYQCVRYVPKDFKQRRPRKGGGWIWALGDVPRVLYRLPELIAAIKEYPRRLRFIVEGEKDVERLLSLGMIATCNVGGAGKWRRDYAEFFRDADVVIVVDPDEPGHQHAEQVVMSLNGVVKSIRWLELGMDVSDWLDDGGTAEQLKELVKAAPPPEKFSAARETVFRREGFAYAFEPAEAPVRVNFSRLTDRRDETSAEVAITTFEGKSLLSPRRLNLVSSMGIPSSLITSLAGTRLGIEDDQWSRILGEGFEKVLNAHRDGLVLEVIQGEIKRPAPAQWLCDGLVMKNKLNCWLGAAGTGKSTLAKMLCACCATGFKFLDRNTEPAIPLYLDWEDEKEDFERVMYDVCRNLGVWPIPKVGWIRMKGKRFKDSLESITRHISDLNAGLLVIDAISAAGGSAGEHRSYEDIALELEQCLGLLPAVSVLGLDHITSEEHKNGTTTVPTKARGAERKVEIYRNQWTLIADHEERERERHIVSWYHTKINAGVFRPQFTIEIRHAPDEIAAYETDVTESPETVSRFSYRKQNELYVAANPGVTVEEICAAVRSDTSKTKVESTARELSRSRQRGILDRDITGRWWPAGQRDQQMPVSVTFDTGEVPWQ